MASSGGGLGDVTHIDAYEHMKQRFEDERRKRVLLTGILVGLVAGILWEAIRR